MILIKQALLKKVDDDYSLNRQDVDLTKNEKICLVQEPDDHPIYGSPVFHEFPIKRSRPTDENLKSLLNTHTD